MKIKQKYIDQHGVKFTVVDLEKETVYYTREDNPDYAYSCLRKAFLERFSLLLGD